MKNHAKQKGLGNEIVPGNGIIFTAVKIPKGPITVREDPPIMLFKLGRTEEETLTSLFGRLLMPTRPLNPKSDTRNRIEDK